MTIKNIGIIGYGSIGQKHHEILSQLNNKFRFFINTKQEGIKNSFNALESFSDLNLDYIIISNETSLHYPTLEFLDKKFKNVRFLIEKPLFNNIRSFNSKSNSYFVGYNLRFHELIDKFKKLIFGQSIISIAFKTYSYLPNWRKNIDYQSSSSALKSLGGGVLRDLSHEIDLLNYLFGSSKILYADSRKLSNLNIETDDYLLTCGKLETGTPFNIELNYFSRFNSREIFVETSKESIKLDLTNSILTVIADTTKISEYEIDNSDSYRAMHKAIISGDSEKVCTIEEAMLVLEQIKQIEKLSL